MYILKQVIPDCIYEPLSLEDINLNKSDNYDFDILGQFWGETNLLNLERSVSSNESIKLTHVDEYYVEDIFDNKKKLTLKISQTLHNKIDGYILFIHRAKIDTDGEILFSKENEIGLSKCVVCLKEGKYVKIFDDMLLVKEGKLYNKNIR